MDTLPPRTRRLSPVSKLLGAIALAVLTATIAHGQMPYSNGLLVTEYPRHEKQTSEKEAFLPIKEFGDPIGKVVKTKTLSPWHHTSNRNAIARGMLQIDRDGDYAFTTDSFYDRNLLMIDGKVVCGFCDGGDTIATVPLKKGWVEIASVGFIGGRGTGQGIDVRWRPPGQRELSAIPKHLLWNHHPPQVAQRGSVIAKHLAIVAKDFVLDVYHNGKRVPDEQRQFLLDRFGAGAERVNLEVRKGDWLVFHVAHNRLRHQGSKFFAVAGVLDDNEFGFVSNLKSQRWSVCDDPAGAAEFIANADSGLERPAAPIERVWEEGMGFMRRYAGEGFEGDALWGEAPSTWIKFNAAGQFQPPVAAKAKPAASSRTPEKPAAAPAAKAKTPPAAPVQAKLALLETRRWPVQILSAIYGTGGKNADVTERVKQLVEVERKFFAANPGHLKVDPNPYWNKSLHIVYMKDGIRRERRYNENGHVLPESFYGPQDAAELTRWLAGTRWSGSTGEVQFNLDGSLTGRGIKAGAKWEAIADRRIRLTWSKKEKVEHQFDYIWSRFGDPKYPAADYRIVR